MSLSTLRLEDSPEVASLGLQLGVDDRMLLGSKVPKMSRADLAKLAAACTWLPESTNKSFDAANTLPDRVSKRSPLCATHAW